MFLFVFLFLISSKVFAFKEIGDYGVDFYFENNLVNITNNSFVIRYGASGDFDDDWNNRNLKVCIGFSKEVQKTAYMWELSWNDDSTSYTYSQLTLSK